MVGLAVTFSHVETLDTALPDSAFPSAGGDYTFKGGGGADVGSFEVTLHLGPLFAWTNLSAAASVNTANGLPVTWSGGTAGSFVNIAGASGTPFGDAVGYRCLAPVEAGQFTVPSCVLSMLPNGTGNMVVQNFVVAPFSADGLDAASAVASIGFTANTTYSHTVSSGGSGK